MTIKDLQESLYSSRGRLSWLLLALFLMIGITLRVSLFMHNRDLWVDECMLILGIVWNPLPLISGALVYEQSAGVGYVYLLKILTLTLGTAEQIVRTPSLFAGLGVIILSYVIMRRLEIRQIVCAFVLLMLGLNPLLLRYANDVKQYSMDAFLALLLLYAFLAWRDRRLLMTLMLATGTLASHSFLFVAVAWIVAYAVETRSLRNKTLLLYLAAVLLPFTISYFLFIVPGRSIMLQHPVYKGYHAATFAPLDPFMFSTYKWYAAFTHNLLKEVLAFRHPLAGALILAFGAVFLWARNRIVLMLLLLPGVFAVGASMLHMYSTHDRLLLYQVPFLFILIGFGVEYLLTEGRPRFLARSVLLLVIISGLTAPAVRAMSYIRHGVEYGETEELGKALSVVLRERQSGQRLYIPWNIYPNMYYYGMQYGVDVDFPMNRWTFPPDPTTVEQFADQIERGIGAEGWVLISHDRMYGAEILSILADRGWSIRGRAVSDGSAGAYYLRREVLEHR